MTGKLKIKSSRINKPKKSDKITQRYTYYNISFKTCMYVYMYVYINIYVYIYNIMHSITRSIIHMSYTVFQH